MTITPAAAPLPNLKDPAIPDAAPSSLPPTPPPPPVPPAPISMMAASSRAGRLSAHLLWVDATANAATLNSVERVREVIARCRAAHINSIVVDVKPLVGEVLYDSRIAPRLAEWKGAPYPRDFDVLAAFIEAGKAAGIPIYASLNIFSEGHKSFSRGPAYDHKEWQVVSYDTQTWLASSAGLERYPIARENEPPGADEIAAYTPASGPYSAAKPGDLLVTYDRDDRVTFMAEGDALSKSPYSIPPGGGLLVARGAGREWLRRHAFEGFTLNIVGETQFVPGEASSSDRYAVFVNPIRPDVRKRILGILREVARKYAVRGIFLDRMRYPNLHADFSDDSRRAFEEWSHERVARWPHDILTFPTRPGGAMTRGPRFTSWLEWRSHVITEFLAEARQTIRRARRDTQIGVYVGSWYSVYYDVGVNWGSPAFPHQYDWMTPNFAATGYAPLLDLLCSGTYYPTAWKSEAEAAGVKPSATVEGSAEETLGAVRDETAAYGSLYLIQYKGKPEAFRQAIRASLATTGGVMIFDLSYMTDDLWWKILEEELPADRVAPHLAPGFTEAIREARHRADAVSGALQQGGSSIAPTSHPPL